MTEIPEDSSDGPQDPSPQDVPQTDGIDAATDATDATVGSGSKPDTLDRARRISRKTRSTRQDVDSDYDVTASTSAHMAEAFRGLRGIAPFLWLICAYAEAQHSRRKTPQSKLDQFIREHPGRVRLAFYLDLSLQAVLVLFLLIVAARGIGLVELIERIHTLITS